MPYRPERQYRSFAASNFQPIEQENTQDDDDKSCRVRGYFCTFNDEYLLTPAIPSCDWPATYEQIDRHAFDGCDISDVIAQYDHAGDVLARTRNGSLKLGFDDHGGYCEMMLDGCQRARDMYESISNGLVVEMSFGFVIADDEEGEGRTYTRDEQGSYHVTITRISKLYDVSCVSIPANPGTDIESIRKRSYMASIIEADIESARKVSEQGTETRSADTEDDLGGNPIEGEVEEFDVESIAQRVAEILDIQYRKDDPRDDDPDDDTDDDNDPDDDDDDVKERELVEETLKRRQRRARAMRLATI